MLKSSLLLKKNTNFTSRKTSTTRVRFLHILQLRFTQVTQLSGFYYSKKELL